VHNGNKMNIQKPLFKEQMGNLSCVGHKINYDTLKKLEHNMYYTKFKETRPVAFNVNKPQTY
jgi:hypothetical protein